METYFYIDHARKDCATPCAHLGNRDHKSIQNYLTSEKNKSHLECCFAKKLFTCWWIFFITILTRNHKKDLQISYLPTEIQSLDRFCACFEDGCLQLALCTSHKQQALLFVLFGKFTDLFLGPSTKQVCHFLGFTCITA